MDDEDRDMPLMRQAGQRGAEKQAIQAAEDAAQQGYDRSMRLERLRTEAADFVASLVADSCLAMVLPDVIWDPVEIVSRTADWQQHTDFARWEPEAWRLEQGYYVPSADGVVLLPEGTDTAVAVIIAVAEPGSSAAMHVVRYMNTGSIAFDMGWRSLGIVTSRDAFDLAVASFPEGPQMTREQAHEEQLRQAVSVAFNEVIQRPEFGGGS